MGQSSSSNGTDGYHGSNYDQAGGDERSGSFQVGYDQGFEDSACGHSQDVVGDLGAATSYAISCTTDGNEGYAAGVHDGGDFGTASSGLGDLGTAVDNVIDARSQADNVD